MRRSLTTSRPAEAAKERYALTPACRRAGPISMARQRYLEEITVQPVIVND